MIMKYIGTRNAPAPQLKDVRLELEDAEKTFDNIMKMIKTAYQKANLVHGDISEYNILYHRKRAVIIDWAQAVVRDHPMSREWLERDVGNIVRYFNKLGIKRQGKTIMKDILEI